MKNSAIPDASHEGPHAVCAVKDVDPATRQLLERLFGRTLSAEQKVLLALLDVELPKPEPQRQAWATIHRILDQAAANLKDVPDGDFDAAIEEAMGTVRPRR